MSFVFNDFCPISDLVSKPKKTFETERAILFEGQKDDRTVEFWVPKAVIANKGRTYYLLKTFTPKFEDQDDLETEFAESADYKELPDFYPIYEQAKKQKILVQNIGSHLILEINDKTTKLKDLFVKSGGERNWHIWNDVDKEYYVFYAQYKPYFKENFDDKTKNLKPKD